VYAKRLLVVACVDEAHIDKSRYQLLGFRCSDAQMQCDFAKIRQRSALVLTRSHAQKRNKRPTIRARKRKNLRIVDDPIVEAKPFHASPPLFINRGGMLDFVGELWHDVSTLLLSDRRLQKGPGGRNSPGLFYALGRPIIPSLVESVNPLAESTIPAATSPRKLTPDYASSPACPGASLNPKPFV
jgi:hypothetical protein